jgi:hypothetical protein
MGNFYGSQAQWRMWGVSRLAERESANSIPSPFVGVR